MEKQVRQALDNLEATLREAGFSFAEIVRLTIYTTDVEELLENHGQIEERLSGATVPPASTLIGVASLAMPELIVEIQGNSLSLREPGRLLDWPSPFGQ